MPYRIEFSAEARDHLRLLTARQRTQVLDAIEEQLLHQPAVQTRNRKMLEANPLASWELRVGNLRVYYDAEDVPEPVVSVIAVAIKDRNVVRIGDTVIEL